MALEISNAQFNQFVIFANSNPNAAKSKAIAAIGADGVAALAARTIVPKEGDSVGKFRRSDALKQTNDAVRTLFKNAIAEMFGGEDNIPASVKDAMLLKDYGKGKPLTARRILAVNAAIEKLKIESFTLQDAFETGDLVGEMAQKAKDAGHTEKDFKMLNTGANLLAKATGMPLKSALLEVMDKSGAAYACASFGPLYTGSVAEFKKGLEIQQRALALQSDAKDMTKSAVAGGGAKDYAAVARARAEQLQIAKKQVESLFAMQNVVGKSSEQYRTAMRAFDNAIADFKAAADDAENGRIPAEKDLYNRIVAGKQLDNVSSAMGNLSLSVFKKRAEGDENHIHAVVIGLKNVNSAGIVDVKDEGLKVFKDAFIERESKRLSTVFHEAEAKLGVKLPKEFYDSMGINMQGKPFESVASYENMAAKLATHSSSILFSGEQKTRLENVVAKFAGKEDAAKLVARFSEEIEACSCQQAVSNDVWDASKIENLVRHFEKNPDLAKAFTIGFKEERMDEVKADLKRVMTENFNEAMQKEGTNIASLKSGFMPEAIREYNPGYVTFNGNRIPDGVTGKQHVSTADNPSRQGLCEFLESKFDGNHLQMRRMVSFACGMANGLNGAISTGAFTGGPDWSNNTDLVKSPARTGGYYVDNFKTVLMPGQRDKRDNYDVRIDDKTGDVTIKLTHYESSLFAYYTDPATKKDVAFAKADKKSPAPVMATARFEVTMTIRNAPDSELGDKPPEFSITDIRQQVE